MRVKLSLVAECAVCVVLVLGVASLRGTRTGSASSAGPAFVVPAEAAPATVARGATTAIDARVTSSTKIRVSVDVEIYDRTGRKWLEHAYDNEAYTAGQTIDHRFSWRVPQNAALGD